jgi:hypothetical protein
VGLPVASKNQDNWAIMQPLLANPALLPAPANILAAVEHFQEMLQIRRSSSLFRLQTAAAVADRMVFHNTGTMQIPGLIVMSLADDYGDVDLGHELIVALFNAGDEAVSFYFPADGREFLLHPVLAASADPVVRTASYDAVAESFEVPARTTAVFLVERPVAEQIDVLIDEVDRLEAEGILGFGQANALRVKLEAARRSIANGRPGAAANQMNAFINQVEALIRTGVLTSEDGEALIALAGEILQAIG